MVELVLIIQQMLASGTHIIAKDLMSEVDPTVVLFYRVIFASLFFVLWLSMKRKKIIKIDRKDFWKVAVLGLLNVPINQFLFVSSIKLTSPPNVALAYALTPAFVLVLATVMIREKLTKLKAAGVLIAITGTFVVISEKGIDLSADGFLGDIMALTASLSWALYTIIGRDFTRKYGAVYATALTTLSGLFLYIPIFILFGKSYQIADISGINWLQIAYLGVLTSGVAYGLWYWALKRSDAGKVSVFNNLQPVFTTIGAIIFFGFALSGQFLTGAALIIGGVILTQKS